MNYSTSERNEIKKQAKQLSKILGDDFATLEKQANDAQTKHFEDYLKDGNKKLLDKLSTNKFKLDDIKPNYQHSNNHANNSNNND